MNETNIVQQIRLDTADIAILWRNNCGAYKDHTGRMIRYGLCVGSSDLCGIRRSDGKFVAIEVKVPGKKPTTEQLLFIEAVLKNGGCAGVATNSDEARKIILQSW